MTGRGNPEKRRTHLRIEQPGRKAERRGSDTAPEESESERIAGAVERISISLPFG